MTTPDETTMLQAAALLRLPLAPAHRAGVLANLQLAALMMALVETIPLGRDDEPAPIFVAAP